MKINADLIVFDLDGTLIDSSEDIAWSANRTIEAFGYSELDMETVKEGIGWGVKSLLEKLMPEEPAYRIEEARKTFLRFYGEHLNVKTRVYPGVVDTVRHFEGKGKKMAVVTNKPVGLAEEIMKELGLAGFFPMVLGGDSLPNKKPHPEPLEKVLAAYSILPTRAVIVGDSPIDCATGKSAGTFTIGVTYGFRSRKELEGAGCDVIISSFPELKDVVG